MTIIIYFVFIKSFYASTCFSDSDLTGSTAPPSPPAPFIQQAQHAAKQEQQQHMTMMQGNKTHLRISKTNANM